MLSITREEKKRSEKEALSLALRLVVSRILRLYATCSQGQFQFVATQTLKRLSEKRGRIHTPGTDEIGYKFICPFGRDIVLLQDKVKEQYLVSERHASPNRTERKPFGKNKSNRILNHEFPITLSSTDFIYIYIYITLEANSSLQLNIKLTYIVSKH